MNARILEHHPVGKLKSNIAIVVVGARKVGKTTLVKKILNHDVCLFLDADGPVVRTLLTNPRG